MEILELDRGVTLAWCALEGETGHEVGLRLLTALYRQRTGESLPPISRTDRGKPYFPGNPLYFSISHTPLHAFCALSPAPIGIDAEETARIVRSSLVDKIPSPGELRPCDAAPGEPRARLPPRTRPAPPARPLRTKFPPPQSGSSMTLPPTNTERC